MFYVGDARKTTNGGVAVAVGDRLVSPCTIETLIIQTNPNMIYYAPRDESTRSLYAQLFISIHMHYHTAVDVTIINIVVVVVIVVTVTLVAILRQVSSYSLNILSSHYFLL